MVIPSPGSAVELVAPHYTGEECDTYSLEVFTMVLFPLLHLTPGQFV